jgi:hypothetical protein
MHNILTIKEIKIKTTLKFLPTLGRVASNQTKPKQTNNNIKNAGNDVGKKGILIICWWEYNYGKQYGGSIKN